MDHRAPMDFRRGWDTNPILRTSYAISKKTRLACAFEKLRRVVADLHVVALAAQKNEVRIAGVFHRDARLADFFASFLRAEALRLARPVTAGPGGGGFGEPEFLTDGVGILLHPAMFQ